ncbi:MAG: formylglycine-generating enzyme family protein [Gammaproteobacteria bacterium]|nr:formylglycine-generating enzyme family protein [Gammaproteobacteria bacterium]
MYCRFQRYILLLLLLSFSIISSAGPADVFDLVTLKNGDVYQGTVAEEQFNINTVFGRVTIPYIHMSEIRFSNDNQSSTLKTQLGEVFTGSIENNEILILRVLDPALPVHIQDIQKITFMPKQHAAYKKILEDSIHTHNGDHFIAQVITSDLMLKTDEAIALINKKNIQLVDYAQLEDAERNNTQLRLTNGEIRQGKIISQSITIETQYKQQLDIPMSEVATLAYAVNHSAESMDSNFQKQLPPASYLRDKMVDGRPGPELVIIKAGEYFRGDNAGDDDERPAVKLNIAAFAIGVYEVTFDEYDFFCKDTRRNKPDDQGWGRGRHPVINVSWNDARAYIQWLSKKTKQRYRLPTDAEWEYAARAGSPGKFWWGEQFEKARANCEGCGSLWDGEKTAEVGKFPANAFGLHDSAGNVFEWVEDCFHNTFEDAPKDGAALDKPGCGKRVIRGGAWSFPVKEIRSANRWRDFPTRRSDDTGFRVVRELITINEH